jgi:molybdate transport system ATP-binding protein
VASALGVELERCSLVLGGRPVLDQVSLDIAPGTRLLLVGPNGAGKTQLIKVLAGLRWPTATGREKRRYRDTRGRTVDLLDARGRIAYVGAESQDKYARYGWNHTIAETVATGLFRTDIPLDEPSPAARRRVASLLERFGLAGIARARLLEVSYGQRRLALVARAIAMRPGLLMLDEVFNGLDDGHRRRLLLALRDSMRGGVTVVASAHRPDDVLPGATAAARVEGGRVVRVTPRQALAWLRGGGADRPAAVRGVAVRRGGRPAQIELRNVSVYHEEQPALRGIDWVLRDGEHWAVTGRNGSGKSTLLGTLYGAHPVAAGGEVHRRGCPPGTALEDIRRQLALVSPEPQASYDPGSTLEEVVVSGLRSSVGLDHSPTRGERGKARRMLDALGLLPLARRRLREVSYGELRLALFARAFVRRPRLLLLDEPFTGLDPACRRRLRAALSRLARAGTQLVIAVHHLDDLPPEVNRRLRLSRGRVTT